MAKGKLRQEIEDIKLLGNIARAYSEISALRMQQTREGVLKNREFSFGIEELFQKTLYYYANQYGASRGKKLTFLSHNGRTVATMFSANGGLYGKIVKDTFAMFAEDIRKSPDIEVAIAGRLGRARFLESFPGRPYTFFELDDYNPPKEQVSEIMKHLVQYEKINVYYGSFQSIVNQKPKKFELKRKVELPEEQAKQAVRYIFEPSIEDVLQFFEGAVFGSIFSQIVKESQLAKLGSRAFALDQANQTIEENIRRKNLLVLKREHQQRNKKQMNFLLSSIRG